MQSKIMSFILVNLISFSCSFTQNTPSPLSTNIDSMIIDKSNSNITVAPNMKLTCNTPYHDEITPFLTTKYFDFTITKEIKSYGFIFIDTCSKHRRNNSLNTNLKIIDSITQQTVIQHDNIYGSFRSNICNDYESMIDLTNLDIGTYTVQMFGITENHNMRNQEFSITFECSFESIQYQTTPLSNVENVNKNIYCDSTFLYEYNSTNPSNSIIYYQFNVSENVQRPISISTCHDLEFIKTNSSEYYQPDTYLYLYQKHSKYRLIAQDDNNMDCNGGAILQLQDVPNGDYIIGVGEHFPYHHAKFKISVQCGDARPVQQDAVPDTIGYINDPEDLMLILFLTLFIPFLGTMNILYLFWYIVVLIFIKYYKSTIGTIIILCIWVYITKRFKRKLKKQPEIQSTSGVQSATSQQTGTPDQNVTPMVESQVMKQRHTRINNDSNGSNVTNNTTNGSSGTIIALNLLPLKSDGKSADDQPNINNGTLLGIPATTPEQVHLLGIQTINGSPPFISKNVSENTKYLFDNINESLRNEIDLDIYQVTAFRQKDPKSRNYASCDNYFIQPFKSIGIEYEFLAPNPYYKALFIAIVTGLLQSFGMFVMLFTAGQTYFGVIDQEGNRTKLSERKWCHTTFDDWRKLWLHKMFACLWAIFITLRVGYHLKQLRNTGFSQIIDKRKIKFQELVNPHIIQAGLVLNLITLSFAVFASYLVIYQSEKEGLGATDLALNALAFFFMIELDNMVVTKKDYNDIQKAMGEFITKRMENKANNSVKPYNVSPCLKCTTITTRWFAKMMTMITLYILGIYAPWIVLICYG